MTATAAQLMIDGTYETGWAGEHAARQELEQDGWQILGQRCRTRSGEIDLIARRRRTIVFVEVKTVGVGRRMTHVPLAARARHRIRRAAVAWIASSLREHRGVTRFRFDVALVQLGGNGAAQVQWVRDAF